MDVLTQRARRGFANFASEPFANFALKNEDGIGIKEMNS